MKYDVRKNLSQKQLTRHLKKLEGISVKDSISLRNEQAPLRVAWDYWVNKKGKGVAVFDMCPLCGCDQEELPNQQGTHYAFWMDPVWQVFFVAFVCTDCAPKTESDQGRRTLTQAVVAAYKREELEKFSIVLAGKDVSRIN